MEKQHKNDDENEEGKLAIDMVYVLCSDWFSQLLFQYLTVKDVTRLDSAICNRNGRSQWLNSLENHFSSNLLLKCLFWSDVVIEWIVARNVHLDMLEINKGYSVISKENIYRLAKQCPNLKKLVISYEYIYQKDTKLAHFIALCYRLESIELNGDFPVSRDLCVWLGACDQLQSIKLTGCSLLSSHIKELFRYKNNLKALVIEGECNAVVLRVLGSNCPLLEHLDIGQLIESHASYIDAFIKGCSKLKTLSLCGIVVINGETAATFTDKLVVGLGMNCPLVECFTMATRSDVAISDIYEAALKSLAQGCPLLKTFNICNIRISAQGTKQLVNHCSKLVDISLSCCDLADDVLIELGKIESLKRLNIYGNCSVTDTGMKFLVKYNGSSLESLNIACCNALTDVSLSSISDHCPNILSITLGSIELTLAGVTRLVEQCVKLIEFHYFRLFSPIDTSSIEQLIDMRKRIVPK